MSVAFDCGEDDTYARPFRLLVDRGSVSKFKRLKGMLLTTSEDVHGSKRQEGFVLKA